MTLFWIIRFIILILLQIITSTILIYHQKYKLSYFTEVLLLVLSVVYCYYGTNYVLNNYKNTKIGIIYRNNIFKKEYIFVYIFSYILMKIILLLVVFILRYFSFYAIVSISNDGIIAKNGYKLFGKKKFTKFVSIMWNRVSYGLSIKKGIPGMVNKTHKLTKVRFDRNGFPIFKEYARVKLKRSLYKRSRETHFRYANKKMYERICKDKFYATKFTKSQKLALKNGETPDGFTWHHHQNRGLMQLVKTGIHSKVNHKGGYSIWGRND